MRQAHKSSAQARPMLASVAAVQARAAVRRRSAVWAGAHQASAAQPRPNSVASVGAPASVSPAMPSGIATAARRGW